MCTFPSCGLPVTTTNRDGQGTCAGHQLVVVHASYLDDRHADGGHG